MKSDLPTVIVFPSFMKLPHYSIGLKTMPRKFDTGATRDDETGKYDYEGAIDPAVLHAFAGYMHEHRYMPDGTIRSADNWQKGIPSESYMSSLVRHVMDLWRLHRYGIAVRPETNETVDITEALGGIFFNVQGLWRSYLIEQAVMQKEEQ